MRCPGQDMARWKPQDLFEVPCPSCGGRVEFFKDDARRRCPACRRAVRNPRLDAGCAEWCRHAEVCRAAAGQVPARPHRESSRPGAPATNR